MQRMIAAFAGLMMTVTVQAWEPLSYDVSGYSQVPTDCDRLASHPLDPFKVADGVSQASVDLAAAIAACEAAVKADPDNPRLNYQLARVYGYSGQGENAYPYRAAAVAADYPQSLFVVGFLHMYGLNEQPLDVCRGGELIHRAALYGRSAALVGYPRYALQGLYDDCDLPMRGEEMRAFLAHERGNFGGDYYRGMLVDMLEEQVMARWPESAPSSDRQR